MAMPSKDELLVFQELIDENRFDFVTLAYLIFGFGEPGTDMEHIHPYEWQVREWQKMSKHLQNPLTRYKLYRLIISSGNGAAKTAFGAMTMIILMYTQKLRGRVTANTKPQLQHVVWPEYDIWFQRAKYSDIFFEKLGESIKARDEKFGESWRFDMFTWNDATPSRVSGLHNKGNAILYTFEEAPGIPAIIWDYANGAFSDVDTIKIHLAFGNSDDPESKFEQNMISPEWRALRIDTRTLDHVDKTWIESLLRECGGNEDHDDFRVRVRGLPRKSSKDAIIGLESVLNAIELGHIFDIETVQMLPSILTCDPAWHGGDETTIWHHQGNHHRLLERYKLDKAQGQDHSYTYKKLSEYERLLKVDAVLIDQGEGTALKTMANQYGKYHWELISFAGSPNDTPEFKDSEYANIRAQMYYEAGKALINGHVITARENDWLTDIQKQLPWTKGGRHKTNLKKIAEPKKDIKERVGQSPDVSDGFVLFWSRVINDRLPENDTMDSMGAEHVTGSQAWSMPEDTPDYEMEDFDGIYS